MINKKGVGVGQVFIFIMAGVAFTLILIFGYRAINSFLSSGEGVQLVQFKTNLESSIKKIYTEYGSVRVNNYRVSGSFQQICFVNLDYPQITNDQIEKLKELNLAAGLALKDAQQAQQEGKNGYASVDENVFLSPLVEGLAKIKVYQISIGDRNDEEASLPYVCPPIKSGSFSLILEGKGDHTKIYPNVG
ncbi:MAG: hypothetical protein WCV90_04550 [Candidatus Woesearchaeota archaeon]